jgi:hypothetical protein
MRDKSGRALAHSRPSQVTSLKVWYSRVPDWSELRAFPNLVTLEVAGYTHRSFEPISSLSRLVHLRLLHFPSVTSLEPLSRLAALEQLSLEALPSYDASRKYLTVESLAPISSLPSLRELRILGVRSSDQSLSLLSSLGSLAVAHIGRGFPSSEYVALRSALPATAFHFPPGIRG